jgi:acetylornithine deacetylase/succinyl-diaminopimelate desuccinylase-like protein
MRLRAEGQPGHGSLPRAHNATGRIGRAVHRLATTRLPPHRTRVVERYLEGLARTQRFPSSLLLRRLFSPRIRDLVLGQLPDPGTAAALAAALSNTAVPTVLRAGSKINVVPGRAEAEVDGRSLPGQTTADLVAEVRRLIDDPGVEIEVVREMPPLEETPETELFRLLQTSLEEAHPGCTVVPYLMPGFTDAKSWSKLGIRSYGFQPVRFPDDGTRFGDLFHGHDERIPVDGLKWGAALLERVVRRFAGAGR